jgi:TATA-binding protein-associated factor
MGLGKTVQGIALDKKKRELYTARFQKETPGKPLTLVISRVSVLGVWATHFKKWQPGLKVEVLDRKNRAAFVASFLKGKSDVYICHYEVLRLMPELTKIRWFHVIADEVHAIKNRKAQVTQALKKIPAAHKCGMSGTPADNRPDDFWSILHWLYPKTFTSYWNFYNRHVLFREVRNEFTGRTYREILGVAEADKLLKFIEPFYVRRLKEDVLPDLPEKYYTTIWVDLKPEQRRAYNDMRDHMLTWVGEHENEPIAAPVVIAQLTRLQQFACAYGKLEIERKARQKGCTAIYVIEPIAEGKAPEGHWRKVRDDEESTGIHSQADAQGFCKRCKEYIIDEREVLRLTEPSSKLDVVMEILEDNPEKSIVVFAQSKQIIRMLSARLKAKGISNVMLTGDAKQSERDAMIDDFQAGKARVFCGTIKAGGVGITLTKADTVIFLDRDWSPSANKQTEDRLHRIGQENAVQVIDVVARDTVDLGRIQQIDLKWSWLKQMLGDKPEPQRKLEEG